MLRDAPGMLRAQKSTIFLIKSHDFDGIWRSRTPPDAPRMLPDDDGDEVPQKLYIQTPDQPPLAASLVVLAV